MKKRKLVILQDNEESLSNICNSFANDEDFEIVGAFTNGADGLNAVMKTGTDYAIIDIVLSGMDGISFLERAKEINPNIKCIVVSAFSRDELINLAVKKGALYYMVRPVDFAVLKERLTEPYNSGIIRPTDSRLKQKVLEEKVSNIFINVGIPPHIKGYGYLREGVMMAVKNPALINNITKQLYPGIGQKYSTSASKVERAIRHAIEVAWNRGRIEIINNLFGVKAYVGQEKPTNGEFIALVADKMLLEMA